MQAAEFFRKYGNTAATPWSASGNYVRNEADLYAALEDL